MSDVEQKKEGDRFRTLNYWCMAGFNKKKMTPSERLVWLILWRSADKSGRVTLSYGRIASESGYTERSCKRVISSLRKKKIIVLRRRGNISGKVNEYSIQVLQKKTS